MNFLYAPEPGEIPKHKVVRENKHELRLGLSGLESMPTSYEVAEDMYEAMMAYQQREILGAPNPGGTLAQPVWWMEAITCVLTAQKHAREEQQVKDSRSAASGG